MPWWKKIFILFGLALVLVLADFSWLKWQQHEASRRRPELIQLEREETWLTQQRLVLENLSTPTEQAQTYLDQLDRQLQTPPPSTRTEIIQLHQALTTWLASTVASKEINRQQLATLLDQLTALQAQPDRSQ